MKDIGLRTGRFLTVLGIIFLVFFLLSDVGSNPKYDLFLYSAASLTLGIYMARRNRPPPVESSRFRVLKKKQKKDKKKEEGMKITRVFLIPMAIGLLFIAITIGMASAQGGEPPRAPASPEMPGAPTGSSSYIPIQGRLTDENGKPLEGTYTLTYRIYDQYTDGTPLCTDDDTLEVEDGLFSGYMYASGCGIDGRQLYLGIEVGTDGEMTPRQFIDNVPYAFSLRPGATISGTIGSNNAILDIENWAPSGRGLRAYAMSETGTNYGVVGASRSPDGYGGYFYNNGGGTALYVSSDDGQGLLAESEEDYAIYATSVNENAIYATSENDHAIWATSNDHNGIWATSINEAGVHGASGSGAGVEGYSLLGPGLYGESLSGVAVAANGIITSSEETYLWVSGNDVRPFYHNDSTYIDFNSRGGARIYRGDVATFKSVILPITIAGTLYGQDVRLTELELYWKGDTSLDSIVTIRLRRQTEVSSAGYKEILGDTTDYVCWEDTYPNGCTIHKDLTTNNILDSGSGILYLTIEIGFGGTTWIDFDGARLTLEYDN